MSTLRNKATAALAAAAGDGLLALENVIREREELRELCRDSLQLLDCFRNGESAPFADCECNTCETARSLRKAAQP